MKKLSIILLSFILAILPITIQADEVNPEPSLIVADTQEAEDMIVQMQNVQGLFVNYYNANKLDLIAKELFSGTETSALYMPDYDIDVIGEENIAEAFASLQNMRSESATTDIHLLASPYYSASEDGQTGHAAWDTYTYAFDTTVYNCDIAFTHFDIQFVKTDNGCAIESLKWYTMQSWVPWDYEDTEKEYLDAGLDRLSELELPEITNDISAQDFVDIQKLQNVFFANGMNFVIWTFANNEEITFSMENIGINDVVGITELTAVLTELKDKETENNGYYITEGMCTSPVITMTGEDSATGWYLVQTFDLKGPAFGNTEPPYDLVRNLCQLKANYIRVDGQWKVQDFDLRELVALPALPYESSTQFRDKMSTGTNWTVQTIDITSSNPSDVFEIENLIYGWVTALRRGDDLVEYFENHINNDEVPFYMYLMSSGVAAEKVTGEEAVRNKVVGLSSTFINLQPNYHTATTPVIEISADGLHAHAQWMEHSLTNMAKALGVDENGVFNYMIFSARYAHDFTKIDGVWYLTGFTWEPLIHIPNWKFDSANSKGWAGSSSTQKYPYAGEEYILIK